ncbi:LysE family transporter [Acuticoccus sp. M5D2P5]|uniref:LysE family translocator n=1 Tax=Acuticoccus kalidii TaxID=2910977 RepID=UPI001F40D223|nr:LysE family transporter [Acuticoccus kalidii]MCF3934704.1 LysE family transporter [Acuticoccus kalidii]
MADDLFVLWLAAVPLMGSPGPATLSLAGIGTAFGFRRGLPYLLGIIIGTTMVLAMIATGITALVLAEPAIVLALSAVAGLYILYLAWKIATAPVGPRAPWRMTDAPTFMPGLALAVANPKAFAAIGAVYAGNGLVAGSPTADAIAKTAALAVVILVVNTAWLGFGAAFSRLLTDEVFGRAINIVFAALLIASVALVFMTA